jgi:hypothetical protein
VIPIESLLAVVTVAGLTCIPSAVVKATTKECFCLNPEAGSVGGGESPRVPSSVYGLHGAQLRKLAADTSVLLTVSGAGGRVGVETVMPTARMLASPAVPGPPTVA